jgi:hypothetical protein
VQALTPVQELILQKVRNYPKSYRIDDDGENLRVKSTNDGSCVFMDARVDGTGYVHLLQGSSQTSEHMGLVVLAREARQEIREEA